MDFSLLDYRVDCHFHAMGQLLKMLKIRGAADAMKGENFCLVIGSEKNRISGPSGHFLLDKIMANLVGRAQIGYDHLSVLCHCKFHQDSAPSLTEPLISPGSLSGSVDLIP